MSLVWALTDDPCAEFAEGDFDLCPRCHHPLNEENRMDMWRDLPCCEMCVEELDATEDVPPGFCW